VTPSAALGLAALLGVLLGSIPVAWILVRWRTGGDVAREGSGNVGALNASRVARSRGLGVVVMLLDVAKGAAAVLLARAACPVAHADLVAGVGAVAGHDYNPWLSWAQGRLVGGKGFAAATGVVSLTCAGCLPAWLAVVAIAYAVGRRVAGITDEAPATALATAVLPGVAFGLHGPASGLAVAAMAALILPKHVGDLRALLRARPVGRG